MSHRKYITVSSALGMPAILVFPGWLTHAEAAAGRKVLSAGFIDLEHCCCYGESTSLGIAADIERDTRLLRALLSEPVIQQPELRRQAS